MPKMLRIIILFLLAKSVILESGQKQSRMVNGTTVDVKDRPYQVAINVFILPYVADCQCGGTIISAHYVLTAAHCVDKSYNTTYYVRVGSSYCTKGGSKIDIKNIKLHPEYKRDPNLINDLAILEMDTAIEFTEVVQPIAMEDKFDDLTDYFVIMSGYGTTSLGGPLSDQLMKVQQTVLSVEECLEYRTNVLPKTLCHIDRQKRSTTCQGNSGGPVTYLSAKPLLVGIISSGVDCDKTLASTSSFIPEFRQWIKNETEV